MLNYYYWISSVDLNFQNTKPISYNHYDTALRENESNRNVKTVLCTCLDLKPSLYFHNVQYVVHIVLWMWL